MFIVLWVVMGVLLGGCAGLLLVAGLKNTNGARASDAPWTTLDYSNPGPGAER